MKPEKVTVNRLSPDDAMKDQYKNRRHQLRAETNALIRRLGFGDKTEHKRLIREAMQIAADIGMIAERDRTLALGLPRDYFERVTAVGIKDVLDLPLGG